MARATNHKTVQEGCGSFLGIAFKPAALGAQ